MTTTAEHIAAIREALEAVPSAGPWHEGHLGQAGKCQCRSIVNEDYAGGIATVHLDNRKPISDGGNDCPPLGEAVANMALIAACNPVAMAAVLAELDRLERNSARATFEKTGLLTILETYTGIGHGVMAIRSLVERAEKAEAENKRMREALEPFADIAGEAWADKDGWTEAACQKDRIVDWFGPSAFHNARAALKGDTHGN